jgi:hypothetical protein
MRPILFAAAIIGAALVLASTDAMAQFYPRAPAFGVRFYGPGLYAPWFFRPGLVHARPVRKKSGYTKHVSTKQASTKQVSTKRVATKQVSTKPIPTEQLSTKRFSTMRPASTTRIFTAPASMTAIPLPDQELLSPQPEFDCELKTTSVDNTSDQGQPNPTRGQADPGADAALRTKLDYERQCYRHAMIILQERLRLLQLSVGETIKAAVLGTIKTDAQKTR